MTDCIPSSGFDTPFRLVDFQGHVLTLANSINPVISQPQSSTSALNQEWIFQQSGLGGPGGLILNSEVSTGGALSYDFNLSPDPGPLFMQAIGQPATSTFFRFNCINSTSANFIDTANSLALTAWAAESGSTISPVTFETLTNRLQQIWTFDLD